MKRNKQTIVCLAVAGLLRVGVGYAAPGDYAVLHDFTPNVTDGRCPVAGLVAGGDKLYGMTPYGGDSSLGVVYSVDAAGGGHALLHSFSGSDGKYPLGSLLLYGTNLYGMTSRGGDENDGVIFRVGTNGGFTVLHHFDAGETNNGALPWGGLVENGGVLYGMSYNGGAGGRGVVFKINPDGSGYTNLHRFLGPPEDGKHPKGDLLVDDGKLYGLTAQGGSNNMGTAFVMDPDGSNHEILWHFRSAGVGVHPSGTLLKDGNYLYGVTPTGTDNAGGIFRMSMDGQQLSWLRSFTGSATDGAAVYSGLIQHDSKLYGVGRFGGASGRGVLFSLGGMYSNQYTWPLGGAEPVGRLVSMGDHVYGTIMKGSNQQDGAVFRFEVDDGDVAIAWCALMWIDDGSMGETLAGDENTRRAFIQHNKTGGEPDYAYLGYGRTQDTDDETWTWLPLTEYGDMGSDYEYTGRLGRASSGDYYVSAKFIKGRHVYYTKSGFNDWGDWDTELYATNRWLVTPLTAPSNAYARYMSTSRIDVHFDNDGAHWVIVFRKESESPEFTDVVDGVEYFVGDDYGARGECVFRGPEAVYTNTGLQASTIYQYRLYTENWSYYSTGVVASASTDPDRDDDGDAMPNQYEVDQGFNPGLAYDGSEDADGDGFVNWKEYVAGTDPWGEESFLAITEHVYDAGEGEFIIRWSSVADKTYALHSTDDLAAGMTNVIVSPVSATPPENVWTAVVEGVEHMFFGVRVHR